jgi:hypothetical protein
MNLPILFDFYLSSSIKQKEKEAQICASFSFYVIIIRLHEQR